MKDIELQFTKMVKEYRKTIYTVCYFYSKDTEEVNDLYQEILINLWKGFEKFRGESSLKTWIWRVSLYTTLLLPFLIVASIQTYTPNPSF